MTTEGLKYGARIGWWACPARRSGARPRPGRGRAARVRLRHRLRAS
ncbi:MAG: hypothetical protein ACLSVD_04790 [Eggerthellaceae bacterium]